MADLTKRSAMALIARWHTPEQNQYPNPA